MASIYTHKMVDGVSVPLTKKEIAELEARDAEWLLGQADRDRKAKNEELLAQIAALDTKRVRPAAEIAEAVAQSLTPDPVSVSKLIEINDQIATLRSQLVL